ncbi:RNA-directed DNA polymerase, eukaryota, reverse transcriptase zinc-binding domain protein [Tanacetum coccineum]
MARNLKSFGFGNKWCSWIKACLNSSRASILINGSPTSEFSIKHGLRQGDPLSPFLFILVMEGLHNALRNLKAFNLGSSLKMAWRFAFFPKRPFGVSGHQTYHGQGSEVSITNGCSFKGIGLTLLEPPIFSTQKLESWSNGTYTIRNARL